MKEKSSMFIQAIGIPIFILSELEIRYLEKYKMSIMKMENSNMVYAQRWTDPNAKGEKIMRISSHICIIESMYFSNISALKEIRLVILKEFVILK